MGTVQDVNIVVIGYAHPSISASGFATNSHPSAGVIGLTTALSLQEEGYPVTIVARDFPTPSETVDPKTQINYTSPWGGAHNRWIPPPLGSMREHNMALHTYDRMETLAETNPEAGITFMKGIEYIEAPTAGYAELTEERAAQLGMEDFRLLRAEEFPDDKVKWGCEYRTWCVNPMVYCAFLLRRFTYRGGKIVKRELRHPLEAYALSDCPDVDIVVDASGIGFGDRSIYPTRGQTCLVRNKIDATITRQNADGTWTFCVPRNFDGGTVIGGTKEPDNWDPEPSEKVRLELLQAFAATHPEGLGPQGSFEVIRDIVGRRPTRRGGMRLDTELMGERFVVHAYGLGGRGYELSWGVSQEVVRLVKRAHSNI
jgi:glycine/D-amino acid oxidase-like deaminating enzyme